MDAGGKTGLCGVLPSVKRCQTQSYDYTCDRERQEEFFASDGPLGKTEFGISHAHVRVPNRFNGNKNKLNKQLPEQSLNRFIQI